MTPKVFVYGLIDPRTRLVRYVGKTECGMARPKQHRSPSQRRAKTHKTAWINELLSAGFDYEIVCLEPATLDTVIRLEEWWICYGRASGWPLTNGTDGGIGARGRAVSNERRQRMSAQSKQQWDSMTPEERSVLAARASERMNLPEYREPNRVRGVIRMAEPERRQFHSELAKAQFGSPEARQTLSERARATMSRPDQVARMKGSNNPAKSAKARATISNKAAERMSTPEARAANSARQSTPEMRAAASARAKAYWAIPGNREAADKVRVANRLARLAKTK